VVKCGYCDFNSYPGEGRDPHKYAEALIAEARRRAPAAPPTVFVGGGTPTYFSAELLARIFRELRNCGVFDDPRVEVTVEANPESATLEKLQALREAGANRISIGVQSFRERYLQQFDRVHSAEQAEAAVGAARRAGFERINVDLIFAKPGETLGEWLEDLERALALDPPHLSCYELTFEEGTAITKQHNLGRVAAAEQETSAELYHSTIELLHRRGFDAYEVSAFARRGEECRHNLVYWTSGDWIGIGAGAGSSVGARKSLNIKNPEAYAAAVAERGDATNSESVEDSDPRDRLAEVLMMGLRLLEGIELDVILDRTGLDPRRTHAAEIDALSKAGLLEIGSGWIRATARGRDLLNEVTARFLPNR
jgi:oxygen-independent coproporphyrinogen-3 oxidase